MLPNSPGQPLTITKGPFLIGASPPRSGPIDSNILRQVKRPSVSFLLICFMDLSDARKDAEWQQQNRAHQFAAHNGRGSIYAFIFRRHVSLAVPAAVARYPSAPEACEPRVPHKASSSRHRPLTRLSRWRRWAPRASLRATAHETSSLPYLDISTSWLRELARWGASPQSLQVQYVWASSLRVQTFSTGFASPTDSRLHTAVDTRAPLPPTRRLYGRGKILSTGSATMEIQKDSERKGSAASGQFGGRRRSTVAEYAVTSVLTNNEVPIFDRELTADEQTLAALGYKYRSMNIPSFSPRSLTFYRSGPSSNVNSLYGRHSVFRLPCWVSYPASRRHYTIGMGYAGTAGMVWGWIIAMVFIQCVAMGMGRSISTCKRDDLAD